MFVHGFSGDVHGGARRVHFCTLCWTMPCAYIIHLCSASTRPFFAVWPLSPRMERMHISVPKPLEEEVINFEADTGYENQSQAVRALLRAGLRECQ